MKKCMFVLLHALIVLSACGFYGREENVEGDFIAEEVVMQEY